MAAPDSTALAGVGGAPRRSKLAGYVEAAQVPYLTASGVPILVGFAAALERDGVTWWLAPLVLLAGLAVHVGTNVVNGVEDFLRGTDTAEMHGGNRAFVEGQLTVAEGRRLYRVLFAFAVAAGVLMSVVTGPAILPIGIVGVIGGYAYTGGPFPYKYYALGDPMIVLLMGPLMSQGAYTALTGDLFETTACLAGLVPGLLIEAVLAANNFTDLDEDRAGGARTLAMALGFENARRLSLAALAGGYLAVVVLVLTGVLPWPCLLVLLTLPLALGPVRVLLGAQAPADARMAPPLMARVHLAAGLALAVTLAVGRLAGA